MKRNKRRTLKIKVDGMLVSGIILSETVSRGLLTGYLVKVERRVVWVATDEVVQ